MDELRSSASQTIQQRPLNPAAIDFNVTPFTVIWETTRVCELRCVHCRADAQSLRDPRELTTAEGKRLLEQIRDLGSPVFVMTGGDPLKRPDVYELLSYGVDLGLSVAVTPSGTPSLTADAVRRFKEIGVRRMALSLDGPNAAVHDGFRKQPGSFDWTVGALRAATECGLPVQINTTVTRRNLEMLDGIADIATSVNAAMWSLFFLVKVGRASLDDQLNADEYETVFKYLYELSQRASFAVRTTAAPHYRRYVMQRQAELKRQSGGRPLPIQGSPVAGMIGDMPRAYRGVTDGNGLAFISHIGEVCPSGFLPLVAGNVRQTDLATIYRTSPIFTQLRDVSQLQGKCGDCEFIHVCAGSRARASSRTGEHMGEEPNCAYHPRTKGSVH